MIINKFGGEIMGDSDLSRLAVNQIKNQYQKGQQPVVVVSALKGITDELLLAIQRLQQKRKTNSIVKLFIKDITQKHTQWIRDCLGNQEEITQTSNALLEQLAQDLSVVARFGEIKEVSDRILSYGEKLSTLLFTSLLEQLGIPAVRLTGGELGVITDEQFGDAEVYYELSVQNIRRVIKSRQNVKRRSGYIVPVIAGFIGQSKKGQTTTLGRGGSDTTACLVGAALKADKVILWKNVAGVLSTDPKLFKKAQTVEYLNYEEAEESGKVIHDKSMKLVKQEFIRVEVTYIRDPGQKTMVWQDGSPHKGVKIISSKDNLRLLIVSGDKIKRYGALTEIARVLTGLKINMVLIRNTRDTLYIVIEKDGHNILSAEKQIKDLGYDLQSQDVSMINVIGRLDWLAVDKFNHLLAKIQPQPLLGAFPYQDCVRLEAVVTPDQVEKLVPRFHREFIN